jgi:hypothetical protein
MKYLFTVVMLTFLFATQANAQFRIGAGGVLGYGSDNFITGINVSGTYIGEDAFDFGAEVTYWLEDNPSVAIDLNTFYLMKIVGYNDDIYISPFGGLNITRPTQIREGSGEKIEWGINAGVSFKKEIGDRLFIIEPKVIIEGEQDFVIKAGFVF